MFFFRFRFTIEITDRVPRMPAVHGPLVYALLCDAFGKSPRRLRALPDGVTVIAPEQLRLHLAVGDHYAFGVNVTASDVHEAHRLLSDLQVGLQRRGAEKPEQPETLAGNFNLHRTEDLFAGMVLKAGDPPTPLDPQHVLRECQTLIDAPPVVTLDFHSPLRWKLPGHGGKKRRLYFDRRNFDAGQFLQKVVQRLEGFGLDIASGGPPPDFSQARVLKNQLVWIDCDYRSARRKKMQLSGAKGKITLQIPDRYPVHCLVWSQYLQLGWSTKFGHGAFRIAELGPDPFACDRSQSLLRLAVQSENRDLLAAESGASVADVAAGAARLLDGIYQPLPSIQVPLESPSKPVRNLSIPQPVDLALQRCVLQQLAPGLDDLFEKSSFAFRRGLGRHSAAAAIQRAWKDGFRWAAQADFERFFDSVDHEELAARLDAYIGDDPLVRTLLQWMGAVQSATDRGLPTGAPLSPLLANLFLDRFDERIRNEGGRLIRYADDFLILTKSRAAAESIFASAQRIAEDLRLRLNADKQQVVDLSQPFGFLGFRFERHRQWEVVAGQPPIEVERLGWFDASRERPKYAPKFLLPGESHRPSALAGTTCIIEPETTWIGLDGGHIVTSSLSDQRKRGPAIDRVHQILVLGAATLDQSLWRGMTHHKVALLMADDAGRVLMEWFPDDAASSARLLLAQADTMRDPQARLAISRELVSAKLTNFAGLARCIPTRIENGETAVALQELSQAASTAETVEQLLGFEGAGAAAWYASLNARLPSRFTFPGRFAPKARDPINVLLNIAHTHIYRQSRIALRLNGLNPALGILHRPAPGHAALASDIQEVFRMLAERAAIETAWKAKYNDFRDDERGHYPLVATATIRRRLLGTIHQSFSQSALGEGQGEPFSFRAHLLRLARSLRTHLLNPEHPLRIYRCSLLDTD